MDLSVPAVTLAALLLGTARATGFVLLAPPFNSRTIPGPVKAAFALALSLLLSTQIQEQTLSFVPKIIAVAIALLVSGNWVLAELVSFTQSLFDQLPALLDRT